MTKRPKNHKSKKSKAFNVIKNKVGYKRPAPPVPSTEIEESSTEEASDIMDDGSVESDDEDM